MLHIVWEDEDCRNIINVISYNEEKYMLLTRKEQFYSQSFNSNLMSSANWEKKKKTEKNPNL